ncbi:MAG: LPS assembly lipoprotein LptE [Bifidobacteriales bacterium]|nr:LPS assembly lipoprotein LptE [Bartonella apis]MCT6824684.1 LPS assembly lipoprotein LptE [Bartonella apis]MCT6920062.1 LPS assembly lipoprotein LptE [Bifidobacteriales bacterium]
MNVSPSIRSKLSGVVIDAPTDRFNQLVRNRLIFLLNGGAGEPSAPTYQLSLGTSFSIRTAVQMDIGDTTDRTGRASAGAVDGRSTYVLKDMKNNPLARRTRTVSASFDRPRQEYANLQAEEDAKKRAAEELAEQIFLSLAQDMSKLK